MKLKPGCKSAYPVPPDSGFMDGNEGWRNLPAQPGINVRLAIAAQLAAAFKSWMETEPNHRQAENIVLKGSKDQEL